MGHSWGRITYRVAIEDPTTWTRPWTLEVPLERQPDKANQICESNCHEGQAKDGSRRADGRDLTLPDGTTLFVGSSGTGAPDEARQP